METLLLGLCISLPDPLCHSHWVFCQQKNSKDTALSSDWPENDFKEDTELFITFFVKVSTLKQLNGIGLKNVSFKIV